MALKGKISNKNTYIGTLYMILSAFCFTLMNAFVRLSGELPSVQKSFFRNLVAVAFAFVLLKKQGCGLLPQKKENLWLLIVRSAAGTLGVLCNFYAVDRLALADASMLNKMSPFFAVIFSMIFLKEKTGAFQIAAVVTAFVGSLFIIRPVLSNMSLLPSVVGFLGGMSAGAAYTAVRQLGVRGEKGAYIVFFFSAFSCILLLPPFIIGFHPMTLKQTAFLLAAGLAAAGGQFSITAAYCHAPAKEISVYDYSQVIFAALLGFFIFGQLPDGFSFLGYGIILSMAAAMFLKNRKAPAQTDK